MHRVGREKKKYKLPPQADQEMAPPGFLYSHGDSFRKPVSSAKPLTRQRCAEKSRFRGVGSALGTAAMGACPPRRRPAGESCANGWPDQGGEGSGEKKRNEAIMGAGFRHEESRLRRVFLSASAAGAGRPQPVKMRRRSGKGRYFDANPGSGSVKKKMREGRSRKGQPKKPLVPGPKPAVASRHQGVAKRVPRILGGARPSFGTARGRPRGQSQLDEAKKHLRPRRGKRSAPAGERVRGQVRSTRSR